MNGMGQSVTAGKSGVYFNNNKEASVARYR